MATLEEQIAALAATNGGLVSAASALTSEVTGKMAQIDQRVNDAVISLGANVVNLFVRPDTGDDNNTGTHSASALQSLTKALELACAPGYSGAYIFIQVEGGKDYHIDQSYTLYNRQIHFLSFNSSTKANIYFDAFIESGSNFTYFSMRGLSLYNACVLFEGVRVHTPMFSDVAGHDSVFTQPSCGIIRPIKNSIKGLGFKNSEVQIGDQYLVVPVVGDTSFVYLEGCSLSLRSGRSSTKSPIELSDNATMTLNVGGTVLNDGLSIQEGSLVSGVRFSSGIPTNVTSNVTILEAV